MALVSVGRLNTGLVLQLSCIQHLPLFLQTVLTHLFLGFDLCN